MDLLKSWEFWVIIYLISAVIFAQSFKKSNRNMQDANILTFLLEFFTGIFSLLFVFLFPIKIATNIVTYVILFSVTILYTIIDRLNIESRYGLEPSTFSMLKQLSTAFIIIFGIIFMKEKLILHKILGAIIIILANVLLTYEKVKLHINKYFIMSLIANILFAIAMLININIAVDFNIAIYTFFTTFIPSLYLFVFNGLKIKNIKKEFHLYDKKNFIVAVLMWSLMLISSVKAYEYGSVFVACFLALTVILNSIVELITNRDKNTFLKKILIGLFLLVGVFLSNYKKGIEKKKNFRYNLSIIEGEVK